MRHKMHVDAVKEMVGKRFNYLVVKSYISREKGYLCICDCGNETTQKGNVLKKGKVKACGCLNKRPRPTKRKPDNYALKNRVYDGYKRMAKRKNRVFELSKETFFNLIELPCSYCGNEKSLRSYRGNYEYFHNGIDRVDNENGYTETNCVTACKICNNAKACLTLEEWNNWINRLMEHRMK